MCAHKQDTFHLFFINNVKIGECPRMVFSRQVFFLPNLLKQFMKQKNMHPSGFLHEIPSSIHFILQQLIQHRVRNSSSNYFSTREPKTPNRLGSTNFQEKYSLESKRLKEYVRYVPAAVTYPHLNLPGTILEIAILHNYIKNENSAETSKIWFKLKDHEVRTISEYV